MWLYSKYVIPVQVFSYSPTLLISAKRHTQGWLACFFLLCCYKQLYQLLFLFYKAIFWVTSAHLHLNYNQSAWLKHTVVPTQWLYRAISNIPQDRFSIGFWHTTENDPVGEVETHRYVEVPLELPLISNSEHMPIDTFCGLPLKWRVGHKKSVEKLATQRVLYSSLTMEHWVEGKHPVQKNTRAEGITIVEFNISTAKRQRLFQDITCIWIRDILKMLYSQA